MSHSKDSVHSKAPYYVCIVEFGCLHCGRRWSSANGSLKDYQKCKNCYTECYPVGSRIREPNKLGNENRQTLQAHNKELCGKCARLGRSCMMLGNKSDSDNDDTDIHTKTVPQFAQLDTREHCQDGNQPVTEDYSLKQWPELATLALRYFPKPYAHSSSNIIKLASTSNDVTSIGMTAAETLTSVIHSAREETSNEQSDSYFNAEDCYEKEYEDSYQQSDAEEEIWDFETFAFGEDEDDGYNKSHYNDTFNRIEYDLDMSDDDDKQEKSKTNEIVAFDDNDDLEPYVYQDDQNYASSQDEEAYFDGIDDTSSDDYLYKKQWSNRLLRRGRKHALQGRKHSLKLIID
ncbi:hypothetical protein MAM1_0065d03937 [Mucor ambiguus]|uniref:Zinc-binding domain-containing protein n=1 Tax=Mucor ambiguus TaxID=91626 RepID=A0A0C9MMS0_9FUNG|nr:hypothetical protein MAM1_0065d03937 [Mucor ambiguus]